MYRLTHGFCGVTGNTGGGQQYGQRALGPRAVLLITEGISGNAQKPWANQFVAHLYFRCTCARTCFAWAILGFPSEAAATVPVTTLASAVSVRRTVQVTLASHKGSFKLFHCQQWRWKKKATVSTAPQASLSLDRSCRYIATKGEHLRCTKSLDKPGQKLLCRVNGLKVACEARLQCSSGGLHDVTVLKLMKVLGLQRSLV